MWLFALVVGWPLIEISLFVTLGAWIGLGPTLAIVLGTAIFGVWLIRRQGARARNDLRAAVMTRQNPAPDLASDALNVVSGVFLVLPGFFTDALGLLLLLPPVRRAVIAQLAKRAKAHVSAQVQRQAWRKAASMATQSHKSHQPRGREDVIDGTWEELPEGEQKPPSGWTRH
jgi:UPF0716 protein FxsA